jgi:hypothetical protein
MVWSQRKRGRQIEVKVDGNCIQKSQCKMAHALKRDVVIRHGRVSLSVSATATSCRIKFGDTAITNLRYGQKAEARLERARLVSKKCGDSFYR